MRSSPNRGVGRKGERLRAGGAAGGSLHKAAAASTLLACLAAADPALPSTRLQGPLKSQVLTSVDRSTSP